MKENVSKLAHIPHTPTLLDNAEHNECQCNAVHGDGEIGQKIIIQYC